MKKYSMSMLMIMAAFFWAGAFIAGKYSVGSFSPGMLTFMRFGIASVVIMVLLIIKQPDSWRLRSHELPAVLVLGLVGMVGYHMLFFEALKHTTATNASMVVALNPMVTALIAASLVGEPLSVKRMGLIGIAFAGVLLTLTNWDLGLIARMEMNVGDVIMLVAVLCWAIYSVLVKRFMSAFTPLKLTAYSFVSCTLMLAPFVIADGSNLTDLQSAPQGAMVAVVYMALFPTVVGYLIQQMSIRKVGASQTSIYINLVPVFSLILAMLILGETASIQKLLSSGMIILAVFLYSRENMKLEGKNV